LFYVRSHIDRSWCVVRVGPIGSRQDAVWCARKQLLIYLATQQEAVAAVIDRTGEIVWQGRAERGDLDIDATQPKASKRLRTRRFHGGAAMGGLHG
jgi:hypothetical protein